MDAWEGIFQQGFHRKVERREALLLMFSLAGMEVGKSRRKKLLVTRCSNDGLAYVRLREACNTTGV